MDKNTDNLEEKIINELKTIFDPEIPVDIYALGLIYKIVVAESNDIKIVMTLTSPNCPVAESLPLEVKKKIEALREVASCAVDIVFEPPWTTDMMSEEAQLELGLL